MRVLMRAGKIIPDSLLSGPLTEDKKVLMDKPEKDKYKMWQERFKLKQVQLTKMPEDEKVNKIFTIEQVKVLEEGKFYEEEEENDDDAALGKGKVNETVLIGRSNLEQDMRLDEFDVAMQEVLNSTDQINLRNKGDPIPAEVRAEFNLPLQMKIG